MEMIFDLFGPGMTLTHRTGLGGLAATLDSWSDSGKKIPGKFQIESDRIMVSSEDPLEFFEALYGYAFQTYEGTIFFPGIRPNPHPLGHMRAMNNVCLLGSFFQHTSSTKPSRKNERKMVPVTHADMDDNVDRPAMAMIEQVQVENYVHKDNIVKLLFSRKKLASQVGNITSTIVPGVPAVYREGIGYNLEQSIHLAIPLHFYIVGATWFSTGSGGVIVQYEFDDLAKFIDQRRALAPQSLSDFFVSSAAEAALKTQLCLFSPGEIHAIPLVADFRSLKKQKYPTREFVVDIAANREVAKAAMHCFPSKMGSGPNKEGVETVYPLKNPVRRMVLANIANGHPWFHDFVMIQRKCREERKKVQNCVSGFFKSDREGFIEMMTMPGSEKWNQDIDLKFREVFHEAMYQMFWKIKEKCNGVAVFDNFNQQNEKWRVRITACRTHKDFYSTISQILSRGGSLKSLAVHFQEINGLLGDSKRWEYVRSLALLSLVSFKFKGKDKGDGDKDDSEEEGTGEPVLDETESDDDEEE